MILSSMALSVLFNRIIRWLFIGLGICLFSGWWLVQQPIRGLRAYVVLSGSMSPTIPVGSLVLTRNISPNAYRPGLIVAFPAPGNRQATVLHRINRLRRNNAGAVEVITKGDANVGTDLWVLNLASLEGSMMVGIPWLGYLLHMLTTPFGFVFTALLLFGFIVLPEIRFLVHFLSTNKGSG